MVNPCIAENSTPFGNYYHLRHHCTFPPPHKRAAASFRYSAALHNPALPRTIPTTYPPAKPKLKQKFNQIRYQLQNILTHNIFLRHKPERAGCRLPPMLPTTYHQQNHNYLRTTFKQGNSRCALQSAT